MGIVEKISCWIAMLGPVGYLPAPGTWGTVCAVPVIYAMRSMMCQPIILITIICLTLAAFVGVYYALPSFKGNSDPSQIVIDEFIGFLIVGWTLPLTASAFCMGFLFFRFFDITKPLGIKAIERLHGALGIMLDDLVAALYAGLCVHSVLYLMQYNFWDKIF